jgi:hypothetical protein
MQLEDLSIKHKNLLEPMFYNLGSNIDLFNFANLFLYRNVDKTTLVKTSKYFIKGISDDNKSFIFPLEPWRLVDQSDISFMLDQAEMIYPVDTYALKYFPEDRFQYEYFDESSDYLYLTQSFIDYKGPHLFAQRSQTLYFLDNYDIHFDSICSSNIDDAKKILMNWSHDLDKDVPQNLEALDYLNELNLSGFIIYIDSKPVSYIFGQPLNQETFLVLFIKADRSFKGIYPYTYQLLAKQMKKYKFLNLEPDLGIESLKKSKRSYTPYEMVKKWRIQVIDK